VITVTTTALEIGVTVKCVAVVTSLHDAALANNAEGAPLVVTRRRPHFTA
jgi:hypothetical protein